MAVMAAPEKAVASVNAARAHHQEKRTGARGGISYCHVGIVAQLRLTASPKCVFYFFFFTRVSD